MNTKGRLLIAFIEVAGATWIAYQQMPSHEKQRVRMIVYRHGMRVCERAAFKIGQLGIHIEQKYGQEVSANG